MANADAMRLSNKAVWGDSVLDALNYYTAFTGLTLEDQENNMARHSNLVTYQIEEVENGFILSTPERQYDTNRRFVFNDIDDLNQYLLDNNCEVFSK